MIDQFMSATFDTQQAGDVSLEAAETYLQAAQRCLAGNRRAGLAALNDLFRSGSMARPDGRTRGQLVALDIAPGLTPLLGGVLARWRPWQGKVFDRAANRGENIFTRDSYRPARALWPFYRHYGDDGPATYRAFPFRTSAGPARDAPGHAVLRLDYDLPINPRAAVSVRRVLDELVQVADGLYLGKAYAHWYWGSWSLVAYFALRPA